MRAIIFACALAALFGSYGADANLGASARAVSTDANGLEVNDVSSLYAAQAGMNASGQLPPPSGRRLSVSSVLMTEYGQPFPGNESGFAVRTRIQTCQGVAVTITSFGGGDWNQELDALCDDSELADESVRPESPAP